MRFPLATPLSRGKGGNVLWEAEPVAYHGTIGDDRMDSIATHGLKNHHVPWYRGSPRVVCTSRSFWVPLLHYGQHYDYYYEEGSTRPAGVLAVVFEVRAKRGKAKIHHPQTIPDSFWSKTEVDAHWVPRDMMSGAHDDKIEWWMDEGDVQVTAIHVRRVKYDNPAFALFRTPGNCCNDWRLGRGDTSCSTVPRCLGEEKKKRKRKMKRKEEKKKKECPGRIYCPLFLTIPC
eukprot:TRINITY_DN7895_c0_g1_i1.p1 TRINITY_DN7895_c0_g1~~TRINITY_DN7895_c0_g1_i1.p1  ORF type:complete len:231 (+),score=54.72 TRINITY_DN7895_c0_g1_i1:226-918(+)